MTTYRVTIEFVDGALMRAVNLSLTTAQRPPSVQIHDAFERYYQRWFGSCAECPPAPPYWVREVVALS